MNNTTRFDSAFEARLIVGGSWRRPSEVISKAPNANSLRILLHAIKESVRRMRDIVELQGLFTYAKRDSNDNDESDTITP